MGQIIFLRHGQAKNNTDRILAGRTEGVPLTEVGIKEASFAGNQLLKLNININSMYTSLLKRAIQTTDIVTDIIGFSKDDIQYDWRLNERHYGALQGLNKSETAAKYGEDQVHVWRRSYDIPPPLLSKDDKRHPIFQKQFESIDGDFENFLTVNV